jgi:heat shock protein HtpX
MGAFTALVIVVAYVLGIALGYGTDFLWFAVVLSVASSFASYWWGDKLILAMSGARPAERTRDFDFFTVAENLAIAAGLPKPKLYVIDDTAMNAFATGRDPEHAIVVATTGILSRLERRELEGVIAHELSHIKNFDTRLMAVVAVLVGTLVYLSDLFMRSMWWGGRRRSRNSQGGEILLLVGIVLAILTPVFAMLMQFAISRRREFLADASGANLTRYPDGLARALAKLSADKEVLEVATNATAHLYITNPFKGKQFHAWFSNMFNTHPPIAERIKRLREM